MSERRKLSGLINPTGIIPCFATPVYRYSGKNEVSIIDIEKNEICSFEKFDTSRYDFFEAKEEIYVETGSQALFGFVYSKSVTVVGNYSVLRDFLLNHLNQFENRPFLYSEIGAFIKNQTVQKKADQLIDATIVTLNSGNVHQEPITDESRSEEYYQLSKGKYEGKQSEKYSYRRQIKRRSALLNRQKKA